jgi:hypothetical protein
LYQSRAQRLSSDGDLNLNTSLDVDDDLLDNLGGGVQAITIISNLPTMTFTTASLTQ